MPDDKPMTPEELAESLVNSIGSIGWLDASVVDVAKLIVPDITAYTESIRREALNSAAEHIPITRSAGPDDPDWLISKGACSCGQLVADGVTLWNKLWGEHIRSLPIDTPPAADRTPEADPSFNDSLRKSDWKNDERLKDIAHDPSLMPEAVRPTGVSGRSKLVDRQLRLSPSKDDCPRCDGGGRMTDKPYLKCPDCHGTGKRAEKK